MSTTIRVTANIKVPKPPNFLLYDGGKMPVGDLSNDDLRRIGEAWTEALLQRAAQQRGHGVSDE